MKPHPFDNEPDWWASRRRSYEDEPFEERFYGRDEDEHLPRVGPAPASLLELSEDEDLAA